MTFPAIDLKFYSSPKAAAPIGGHVNRLAEKAAAEITKDTKDTKTESE